MKLRVKGHLMPKTETLAMNLEKEEENQISIKCISVGDSMNKICACKRREVKSPSANLLSLEW